MGRKKKSNVIVWPFPKVYQELSSLHDDLYEVVVKYNGKMSIAEVLGVIELLKIHILEQNN